MLIGWVVQKFLDFQPCGQIFAPSRWAKNWSNPRFPDINRKDFHSVHFKPCWCAYWVIIKKFFKFRPCDQIFCHPLLSINQIDKALIWKAWCLLLVLRQLKGLCHHWCLVLTHWGRDKMAAIFQTTFWNAFSWMIMHEFRLIFDWSLFLRFQLTIFQHWFR